MVVKIGSSTLVEDGELRRDFISALASQARDLREAGWNLVVVSSGAIACGAPLLGFERRPVDMPSLQACASVGQCVLSAAYDEEFRAVGLLTSLVLLTRGDTARRTSYLHARDALTRLVDLGVVPIVNENDTTAVDEIKFGDNDTLAALVSCLVSADLCVTLSDIDGLYTANPSLDPTAKFIPRVDKIDAAIIGSAGDSTTTVGTGGMITKIRSCRILMTAGIESVICSGAEERPLVRLAAGEQVEVRSARRPPRDRAAQAVDRARRQRPRLRDRGCGRRGRAGRARQLAVAGGHYGRRGGFRRRRCTRRTRCRWARYRSRHRRGGLANKPAIHRDNLIVFA